MPVGPGVGHDGGGRNEGSVMRAWLRHRVDRCALRVLDERLELVKRVSGDAISSESASCPARGLGAKFPIECQHTVHDGHRTMLIFDSSRWAGSSSRRRAHPVVTTITLLCSSTQVGYVLRRYSCGAAAASVRTMAARLERTDSAGTSPGPHSRRRRLAGGAARRSSPRPLDRCPAGPARAAPETLPTAVLR
jgi:hypothetical protein